MCGSRLNRCAAACVNRTPWGEVKITAAARPRSMSMASSAAKIGAGFRTILVPRIRDIVDDPMTIGRKFAQVADLHIHGPALDRPAEDAFSQRLFEHRRKNRDDIELHACVRRAKI